MSANRLSRVTDVPERNAIRVELTLPSVESLNLDGEIVFRIERLGFGVRFLNVNAPHKQALGAFIDKQEVGTSEPLAFPRVRGHKQ